MSKCYCNLVVIALGPEFTISQVPRTVRPQFTNYKGRFAERFKAELSSASFLKARPHSCLMLRNCSVLLCFFIMRRVVNGKLPVIVLCLWERKIACSARIGRRIVLPSKLASVP